MNTNSKLIIGGFIVIDILLVLWLFLNRLHLPVLNPAGTIAIHERNIIFFLGGLGLLVIIPIVLFTFFTAFKYREENKKNKYTPNWNKSLKIEIFRWSLMSVVIGIFAVTTWIVAHTLDPYRPLDVKTKPVNIQVVALQWRWLFIYPEQNIATINFIEFPEKTPVNFELTADAPMNSFWIPDLGGQIYAMSGMSTRTHFMANSVGEFPGSDAEISGKGFADMRFTAKSVTQKDFNDWVKSIQTSAKPLTFEKYKILAKPSTDSAKTYYTLGDKNLYNKIINQFMAPNSDMSNMKMGTN
jgi:cytochrome o ubiquinol oxidase subunit 2